MSKNRFGGFWNFDPWWPHDSSFDLSQKMTDMISKLLIFRERSNAVFRFVLRCAGAEIDGGVFKHPPPPPAGGGKF